VEVINPALVNNVKSVPVKDKVEKEVVENEIITTVQSSVQQPPGSPEIPTPAKLTNESATTDDTEKTQVEQRPPPIPAHIEKMLIEIKHKKEKLRRLTEELFHLQHMNGDLAEQTRITHERMLVRQKDQKQLMSNYNEHIRSRRATDDSPQTIHKKLLDLKTMIKNVSVELAKQCDPTVATKAISSFWVNLHDAIAALGSPLPRPRIVMLIEKFMMDVLIQNMNYNVFMGLRISSSYTQLQMWFERYEPSFGTRFRQEIAKVAVSGGADIQQEIQKFNKRMYASLYTSLTQAFPFMEQQESYAVQLMSMVELASHIGYAMRGQEIEIAAVAVGEGSEVLDSYKMVDVDGQTAGVIQLCICPPFIMYGNRMEILEKARVLCFPSNDTS
jgi:hypothetical protein